VGGITWSSEYLNSYPEALCKVWTNNAQNQHFSVRGSLVYVPPTVPNCSHIFGNIPSPIVVKYEKCPYCRQVIYGMVPSLTLP
jgi:hypothetical protein